jgi:hypothetical protein
MTRRPLRRDPATQYSATLVSVRFNVFAVVSPGMFN